jgi:hypothetical protein
MHLRDEAPHEQTGVCRRGSSGRPRPRRVGDNGVIATPARQAARRRSADMTENLIKVWLELDSSDWHGHGSESLWAAPIVESEWRHFRLMNSPFFARGISYRDVVNASATERGMIFDFKDVVERSGHSTYMLLSKPDDACLGSYWNMLEKCGCSYESTHINLRVFARSSG